MGRTYHTSGAPGFPPVARAVTYFAAQEMGFDILREFWPEIAHKLKMPLPRHSRTKSGFARKVRRVSVRFGLPDGERQTFGL